MHILLIVHILYAFGMEETRKCEYVIKRRQRQCRMVACKGSKYCGEHLLYDQQATVVRQRIPCPLDSSHTVFEDCLSKHLKKCNVTKKVVPLCFSPGINEGTPDATDADHPQTLAQCPPERLAELMKKVEAAYEGSKLELKEEFLWHPCLSGDLADASTGPSASKHLTQQSSILAHLGGCGLLETSRVTCYVEFGAGRGKLTHCIHRAIQHSSLDFKDEAGVGVALNYVLVDRASCRRKVDGVHRAASTLSGAACHRLLIDIKDLDLSQVEAIKGRGYVGVGKHLCGSATDMALRCMVNQKERSEVSGCGHLRGVAIALCCHHRCTWGQLVGSEFMLRHGFTPEEFGILSHMTSWAVCGRRPPAHQEGNPPADEDLEVQDEAASGGGDDKKRWGYVPHPNEELGLKCKRLIDLARVHYLEQNGLKPRLLHYVDKRTSLENVLLLATTQ